MGWVGGQLLLSGVVLPALRARLPAEARGPLIRAVAMRFAVVSNVLLLPLLLITGTALAMHRGVNAETFTRPGYGRLLTIKLILVVVSVGLAAVHGMLASQRPKTARPLGIVGLATSLAIVVFATALVP